MNRKYPHLQLIKNLLGIEKWDDVKNKNILENKTPGSFIGIL